LRVGQVLQATSLSGNIDGKVELRIGVTRLIAQTQLALEPGQPLSLRVEKAGPLPELRLLIPPDLAQLRASALKQVLPRQQPLGPLLQRLSSLAGGGDPALPGQVRQAAAGVLAGLAKVDSRAFTAELGAALLDSGLFSESRLLHGVARPTDLKLNLLRLLGLVKTLSGDPALLHRTPAKTATPPAAEVPGEQARQALDKLGRLLDGALARIQTHQLASLPGDDSGHQAWQFELPIMGRGQIDLLRILVRREAGPGSKAIAPRPVWSLTLQLEPPGLGPLRAHLRLQGETLSTRLWAEVPATAGLLQAHLPELRETLESSGLKVDRLEAHRARLPADKPLPSDISLLHEKA